MEPSIHLAPRLEKKLFLCQTMKQGLVILQMPLLDLKKYIYQEIEQNPLLEWKEDMSYEEKYSFSQHFFSTTDHKAMEAIPKKESLFEKLNQQINETFDTFKEKEIAHLIIGNLDEKGLFTDAIEEIAKSCQVEASEVESVRKIIQAFEPLGIGSRTLQEFLLLQLNERKKQGSFAYQIIQNHFSSLLRYQFSKIEKELKISHKELLQILQKDLRPLKFSPIMNGSQEAVPSLLPDFTLYKEDKHWVFQYQKESLLKIHADTPRFLSCSQKEEKRQLKIFLKKANDLIRGLRERKKTLKRVALYLLKKQFLFFEGKDQLVSLTIKQMAEDLQLHPSTAARAVAHKYLSCPQGIFPLRTFFSSSITTPEGNKVSQQKALFLLKTLIQQEDKEHPFSDQTLSLLMKKANIPLARRTVVKYRKALSIQTASRRKRIFS